MQTGRWVLALAGAALTAGLALSGIASADIGGTIGAATTTVTQLTTTTASSPLQQTVQQTVTTVDQTVTAVTQTTVAPLAPTTAAVTGTVDSTITTATNTVTNTVTTSAPVLSPLSGTLNGVFSAATPTGAPSSVTGTPTRTQPNSVTATSPPGASSAPSGTTTAPASLGASPSTSLGQKSQSEQSAAPGTSGLRARSSQGNSTELSSLLSRKTATAALLPSSSRHRSQGLNATLTRLIEVVPGWIWAIIATLALIAIVASARSYFEGRRRARLSRERSALAADLSVLQSTLLPELPIHFGPFKSSAAYAPAAGLAGGGDFYDAFPLADGRLAFLIGDVSGHGRESISRAALARYTMRAFLQDERSPAEALKAADHALSADGVEDGFVTAVACVFDPQTRLLTYAQAGHHAPLFSRRPDYEPVSGVPLGTGLSDEWPQTTTRLEPGERVCLFTDGAIEGRRGPGHELLGRERLRQLFLTGKDSVELLDAVRREVGDLDDDLALVVLELEGSEEVAAATAYPAFSVARLQQ